tara:strand:- start:65 stop:628 length:564 start_codon:yes stop_codon:yes gene_type:complete
MKYYSPYIVAVIATIIFTTFLLDSENKIEELEYRLQLQADSLQCEIDSLQYVSDSLVKRYEMFDVQPTRSMIDIINAIIRVESSNDDSAYNKSEDAVGCLQIRKCMVNDVNRILKRLGKTQRFTYDDRWIRYKSIQMFDIFCSYYKLYNPEEIARCWNGGPRGINNPNTIKYWNKVENQLEEIYAFR